ncbi:MAG TPA: energy-coupling factor transporter transmembrane component T [Candidatus Limnocylindrales bacterium]|nr:energy-coupling factor transporter transmembrane component T [Candidatus Limnocylindrales bacterium]
MTGFFVPGSGWLHRLHPWPKVLLVLAGVLAPFVVPIVALPVLIVAAVVGALAAGLGRGYLRNLAIGTLPAVASILIVNGFFFPGARDVLLALGPFNLTREGLAFGVPIALRIVAAVAVTIAFVMSTRPDDLMEALIDRGASPKLAFVVLGAIQTIPRMQDKANRILDAQQARGLRTSGSFRARARAVVPLLGPLVIGSLIDVRERSLALEARGFGTGGPRTAYRVLETTSADRLVSGLGILALVLLALYTVGRLAGLLP